MGSISPELASKRRLLKFLGDDTPVVGVPFAPSEHQPGKEYFCRSNLSDFIKQAFDRGFWCAITWRQCAWRHLVPFFFIAIMMSLGLGMLFWSLLIYILLVLGLTYIILSYYCGYKTLSKTGGLSKIGFMPVLFFLWHTSYGLGSWWAWLSRQLDRNK